jgi:hypothetical protein
MQISAALCFGRLAAYLMGPSPAFWRQLLLLLLLGYTGSQHTLGCAAATAEPLSSFSQQLNLTLLLLLLLLGVQVATPVGPQSCSS